MIIDTHCHLFNEEFDEKFFLNLEKNNLIVIINGYNYETNKQALDLSNKYKNVYCSLGHHPNECESFNEESFLFIKNNINNAKTVAIGEIGLDYYRSSNKEKQQEILKKMLSLAEKHNKPVIIHNRESTDDIYNILSKYNLKGIMHAFNEDINIAKKFLSLKYKLGIGGVITFKNSKIKETLEKISINDIVLETDTPYLTPVPYRGKKNNPIYIKYVLEEVAKIKDININEIREQIYKNTKEILKI